MDTATQQGKNMAYTLQRKMFKLGGSVAHGGGITANLKNPNRTSMKKGGKVAPIGQVGKGPLYMKGPDGKMREMQNPLALILGGAGLLSRGIPLATRAAKFLMPRGSQALIQAGRKRSLDPIKNYLNFGQASGASAAQKAAAIKKAMETGRAATMKSGIPVKLGRGVFGLGTGAAGLAGLGVGLPSALLSTEGPDDTNFEKITRAIGRTGVDLSGPGLATNLVQRLRGTATEPKETSLYNLISGKETGPAEVPKSETRKVATKQVSEMEKLKNQALERKELYESLMYEPDKLALASNALLSAGTSALRGDELADVVEAGFSPINTEAARRREIESASSQQAITDILNDKATRQAILAEVAKSGDTRAIARVKKFFDASDQGVDDALPMNAKGAMDTTQMRAGTIYADVENATGKLFVAVNESGSEIKQFDTIEEAIEHSQKP